MWFRIILQTRCGMLEVRRGPIPVNRWCRSITTIRLDDAIYFDLIFFAQYYAQQPMGMHQETSVSPQGPPQGRWRDGMFDCCTNLWPSCGCMFIFSGVSLIFFWRYIQKSITSENLFIFAHRYGSLLKWQIRLDGLSSVISLILTLRFTSYASLSPCLFRMRLCWYQR